MTEDQRAQIARLNDQFRKAEREDIPGTFLVTSGLNEHALESGRSPLELLEVVATYDGFNEDSNPYGERDFGVFDFEGQRCYWKIDYFSDDSMSLGSDNPADPAMSYRVLTVMLSHEY